MKKIILLIILFALPLRASAGVMELSGSFWFNQSQYGDAGSQWSRRWSASLGYYFLVMSELEFTVQDVFFRTNMGLFEDTSLHDRLYSVNWVQSFAPREFLIQPFAKIGLGQINRTASGSMLGGFEPSSYRSLTGVLGVGVRLRVYKAFSIRVEGTTYLTEGVLSSWRNNVAFNAGFSLLF